MPSKFKRIKNKGGLEAALKRIQKPGTVDSGIIDAGDHPSGDATVAQIGFWNEFGTTTIPERSFIRSTIQKEKKNIIALQRKLWKQIVSGKMKIDTGLGLLGEFMADAIRKKIVSLSSPANKPATIAAKGSSNPLIDTGQLKNSISFEVNK